MVEIINSSKIVKARKEYKDQCAEFILEVNKPENLFTEEEIRIVERAREDGWKIKKGEFHEYSVFKNDGDIYSFRNKIGLANICQKYDLFPEV